MNKKAQGLSLNVIIIAALALIVLVVLVAIFTGQIGGFGKGTQDVTGDAQSCNTMCITVQGYLKGTLQTAGESCTGIKFTGVFSDQVIDQGVKKKQCCCLNK